MENLDSKMLEAALNGNLTTVEELVLKGANINYINASGNFAAFSAAWDGNTKALDLFYNLGAKISFENANLLCNAAYNGKVDSVKWLLNKGEDANFSFKDTEENALHYTISKTSEMGERTEIVKILIAAGTDVTKKTTAGKPTLCFMRDAYLKGESPLHRAAAFGNVSIVKMLLEAGADPSMKDANGDTPISWGSWYLRDADILRLLVYEGISSIH
ncbi:ankyrin repeat domain-containing protein [Niabella beijingensis]|uniref:ankyrin repeat domain-containing protein n=1 Tax=Niabella beijingensis TaxID=2872700 RepID=UPI001CBEABB9|nr:ankyrin repeat domain-containing protein [Niabella beijingensis]MBZ4192418.1 ankyrin repeat domain-containing protein [Niabella beijingensis]